MTAPQNDYEALKLALTLAITAPTDEKCAECVEIAEEIASRLSPEQVEAAKIEASA
jgi:hypothetical protein